MTEQTKAQRLAALLESAGYPISAAELRLLDDDSYAWCKRSHMWMNEYAKAAKEVNRLAALNAELVEALEKLVDIYYDGGPLPVGEIDKVEAALAKAKEQT